MADDLRIIPDERAIALLPREPWVRQYLLEVTSGPVRLAQARAPRDTGAGAASIHSEALITAEGWEVDTSWDRDHYYMRFHELGTKTLPAHPFLVPAFEGGSTND